MSTSKTTGASGTLDETAVLFLAACIARALNDADPAVRLSLLKSIDDAYRDLELALNERVGEECLEMLLTIRERLLRGQQPTIEEIARGRIGRLN